MTFGAKNLLWLLLVVPALAALIWWSFRARRRAMAEFVGQRLLESLTIGLSRTRQKIRAALLVAAFALLIFSLSQPRWGYELEEARQRGLDIVVAIDTSKSMLADDVQPNRLTRAKLAALDLMRLARTDRLGLVAFAGTAFLQCPLSIDAEAYRQSVEALDVTIIPQGGTALSDAIQTALTAFKEKNENHKVLILFTDGEDNDPGQAAAEAAQAAAKEGMRIFTVGVGTPAGELLSTSDPFGNRVFIKDSAGNVVKSRLNEPLLQEIAKATDGFYLPATGSRTMDVLYERGLAPLPKGEFSAKTLRRYHERFQWFLGLGIVLLLAEMFFPERTRRQPANAPAKSFAAVAGILLAFSATVGHGAARDALNDFKQGKYTKSKVEFERLARKSPDDARLRYNAGAAAFHDENYDQALAHFGSSLASPDLTLQQRSYYNLGNTRFRLGQNADDPKQKQEAWEQAIRDFENALKLDPKDEDAQFNATVVKQKLEELKKQQQQQQKDQNKDQNKDQQDKKDQQDQKNEQKKDEQDQSQEKKDNKSEDQKKQEDQSSHQESEQQKQEKAQEAKQDPGKGDQKEQQQAPQDQRGDKPDVSAQAAQYGKVMQMTPQQAMQLLEAQKAEEKAMIFIPQNTKTNRAPRDRMFKDW